MIEMTELIVVGQAKPKLPLARHFNFSACAVAMAFQRRLVGISAHDCRRLCISCRQGIELHGMSAAGDRLELPVEFDFDRYFALDNQAKKAAIATTIVDAVRRYKAVNKLKVSTFERIRDELAAISYNTHWYHGDGKRNRSRTLYARVRVAHEVETCNIVVEVLDANKRIVRAEVVASPEPLHRLFIPYLGKLSWKTADTVVYAAKGLPRPRTISITS